MSEESPATEPSEIPVQSAPPEAAEGAAHQSARETGNGQPPVEMIENFPPEIAALLIVAGAIGVVLPGPIGAPLLIAGGVVLWPKTFRPIEKWFSRKFPVIHREGVAQLKEFLANLNHRFPDQE